MELHWLAIFLGMGAFAGFFAGLLGLGGGAVLVPLLSSAYVAMGFAPELVLPLALGSSMACIVPTSLSSTYSHWRSGKISWPVVAIMAPGIACGSFLGSQLVMFIPQALLTIVFSLFISYVALTMLLQKAKSVNEDSSPSSTIIMAIASFSIGIFSALVAIGGGSLTVPLLSRLGFGLRSAIACSAALGVFLSLTASVGYLIVSPETTPPEFTLGLVYLPAVALVSIASVVLAPVGAYCAHHWPVAYVKRCFSLVLLMLASKMLWTMVMS
ncbi:MAG: putative membrane protein YfcA [Flavobacteriales bacterium]|jgi:uncharacterized membrane protein YfcA